MYKKEALKNNYCGLMIPGLKNVSQRKIITKRVLNKNI